MLGLLISRWNLETWNFNWLPDYRDQFIWRKWLLRKVESMALYPVEVTLPKSPGIGNPSICGVGNPSICGEISLGREILIRKKGLNSYFPPCWHSDWLIPSGIYEEYILHFIFLKTQRLGDCLGVFYIRPNLALSCYTAPNYTILWTCLLSFHY